MEILAEAVHQAKEARTTILGVMAESIKAPNELSKYAPRIETIKIDPDKIGGIIGPGGKIIKGIQAETGAEINIEDDGTVHIYSTKLESLERCKEMINNITADIEIDKIYEGKIVSTTNFGAFMEVLPGRDGMIHISELASYRVEEVEDVVRVGDRVTAKCIGVDDKKRVKMSRKAALEEKGEPQTEPTYEIGERKPREERGGGRGGRGGDRRGGGGGGRGRRD